MNPSAMDIFGEALAAYFGGDKEVELWLCRDDGRTIPLPVGHFFRQPGEFTTIEITALDSCTGRILDIGAGTGLHSLVLQERGVPVTAIDVSPQAVIIMKQRGVKEAYCADLFAYRSRPYDTLLMLGHGIGMAENLTGLDRFLIHARDLVHEDGQLLLDSLDVRVTDDAGNLAYLEANRESGLYFGEIRMQFEFASRRSTQCGWLHVDPETLNEHARGGGWDCEVLCQLDSGDYLARLSRSRA